MKAKKIEDDYVLVGPDDYEDDCPVCQMMREAEKKGKIPTMTELDEAFEKSKEVGGIVGRPAEEKDKIPD